MDFHDAGTVIDNRYEVIRLIGRGGFGAVYQARDTQFKDRMVAVKQRLDVEGETASDYLDARFEEECLMLERLEHAHIPRIYHHFRLGGAWYLVMEYVEGRTLAQWHAQQGPLSAEAVLEVGLQICEVLEYLQTRPVPLIHRDVKPHNIVLRSDQQAVLVDFGLARTLNTEATGTQVGTIGYAALEQVRGRPEPCSDIYSLGATLFFLLTGQDPSPFNIPPLGTVRPDLPEKLAALVTMATQQNPARRFLSATHMRRVMVEALAEVRGDTSAPARDFYPAIESAVARPFPWALGLVVLLAFGVVAVGGWKLATRPTAGRPAPVASSVASPTGDMTGKVHVVFQSTTDAQKRQLADLMVPAMRSSWEWSLQTGLTPEGHLAAGPDQAAALVLNRRIDSNLIPCTVYFRAGADADPVTLRVYAGDAMGLFHFDTAMATWAATLLLRQGGTTGDSLHARSGPNGVSPCYGLHVAADGADLRQDSGGSTVHLAVPFDTTSGIEFVVLPGPGDQRIHLQDVEVTHEPLRF